jgi:hypothetical protein
LGCSTSPGEAKDWVEALVVLFARLPASKSSSQFLVEVMKFLIAAGGPSDQLLLSLQKALASLRGPAAGLRANSIG